MLPQSQALGEWARGTPWKKDSAGQGCGPRSPLSGQPHRAAEKLKAKKLLPAITTIGVPC